jgi:hypothetical protein
VLRVQGFFHDDYAYQEVCPDSLRHCSLGTERLQKVTRGVAALVPIDSFHVGAYTHARARARSHAPTPARTHTHTHSLTHVRTHASTYTHARR